jgi:hypothetical protein
MVFDIENNINVHRESLILGILVFSIIVALEGVHSRTFSFFYTLCQRIEDFVPVSQSSLIFEKKLECPCVLIFQKLRLHRSCPQDPERISCINSQAHSLTDKDLTILTKFSLSLYQNL